MNFELLSCKATDQLRTLVGQTLNGVIYWCLMDELSPGDILDPNLYIGGEIELKFANRESVFITWDENGGWPHDFSVKVAYTTTFIPDSLEPIDACASPHWKPHIGSILSVCSVLGWFDTPHIVRFRFPSGEVLVGDGYGPKQAFGDGDDLIVKTGGVSTRTETEPTTLWESTSAPL